MRHEGKRTCLTRTARSERKNIPPETLETRNIKKLHGTHSRTHPTRLRRAGWGDPTASPETRPRSALPPI